MTAKEEILALLEELPEAPTYAEAFERVRPLYNREVAPIISQYGEPPRPLGLWRRDITGSAEAEEQRQIRTYKTGLLRLVQSLPDKGTRVEAIDEAMCRLTLSYRIQLGERQIAEGRGIPHEEVRQRIAQWRGRLPQ